MSTDVRETLRSGAVRLVAKVEAKPASAGEWQSVVEVLATRLAADVPGTTSRQVKYVLGQEMRRGFGDKYKSLGRVSNASIRLTPEEIAWIEASGLSRTEALRLGLRLLMYKE